jgi:hypothetical protein
MMLLVDEVQALLERVEAGELGDPLPVLAYIAGQRVELDGEELNAAKRRAITVLAAGGDVHRDVDIDDVSVKRLAVELHTEKRRAQLGAGVDELALRARDLPRVREAALYLAKEVDLAWRLYALGLLAEELDE